MGNWERRRISDEVDAMVELIREKRSIHRRLINKAWGKEDKDVSISQGANIVVIADDGNIQVLLLPELTGDWFCGYEYNDDDNSYEKVNGLHAIECRYHSEYMSSSPGNTLEKNGLHARDLYVFDGVHYTIAMRSWHKNTED